MDKRFDADGFIPDKIYTELKEIRKLAKSKLMELLKEEARLRHRRTALTRDGKLMIVAADHPARGILSSGIDEIGMAQRRRFLARVIRVIASNPDVDGVMGTPDVIEDMVLINRIVREKGGEVFLSNRLLIGCMNRLGIFNSVFELDDGMSAYSPRYASEMGLDGVKMMFRYEPNSRDSRKTIEYCLSAMNECHNFHLPVFLEAVPVERMEDKWKEKPDIKSLMQVVCIANGLSTCSAGTWLKLPYRRGNGKLTYRDVVDATTYPVLVLGGAATGQPDDLVRNVNDAIGSGASGGLIGRQILFCPEEHDPYAIGRAISHVIHHRSEEAGRTLKDALELLKSERGRFSDVFSRLV